MEKVSLYLHVDDLSEAMGSEATLNVKNEVPTSMEEEYHSDESEEVSQSNPASSKPSPTEMDVHDDYAVCRNNFSTFDEIIHGADWPICAYIRLFHLIIDNGLSSAKNVDAYFFNYLSQKMAIIASNDAVLSGSYIHEDDFERYKKSRNAKDGPVEYFRPKYEIDCSPENIKNVINELYDLDYMRRTTSEIGSCKSSYEQPKAADVAVPAPSLPPRSRRSRREKKKE